jgi:hypothetical protein
MSSLRKGLLSVMLSFAALGGCADNAALDDGPARTGRQTGTAKDADDSVAMDTDDVLDDECMPKGDAGPADAGKPDSGVVVMRDAGITTPKPDAGGGTTAPKPDAGGGTTVPKPSTIAGSALKSKCSSVAKPASNMCGSYYCGVDQGAIEAELSSDSLCANVEAVCEGRLVSVVASCARSTLIANLGQSFEAIRPKVQECVYKDAQFKQLVTESCLGCFLDAAVCAGNKCLAECLADGPGCDACRQKNNCDQAVFSCAKLPNPF